VYTHLPGSCVGALIIDMNCVLLRILLVCVLTVRIARYEEYAIQNKLNGPNQKETRFVVSDDAV
jgi:hypothetical protein